MNDETYPTYDWCVCGLGYQWYSVAAGGQSTAVTIAMTDCSQYQKVPQTRVDNGNQDRWRFYGRDEVTMKPNH